MSRPIRFAFFILAALAPVLLADGWSGAAGAVGNVLVPDSTNAPNLGLMPRAAAPAADAAAAKPDDAAATAPAAPAVSLPALTDDGVSTASPLPATPIPGLSNPPGALGADGQNGMPTTVIDEPSAVPYDLGAKGMAPPAHRLTISLSQKSAWGPDDIAAISDKLGIAAAQVPSQCRLTLTGLLITDKTPGAFDTAGAPQAVGYYDGNLSMILINARALCPVGQLPPNRGYVIHSGNGYAVPLTGVTCPAPIPGRPPAGIVVQYSGNGASSCQYQ